MGRRTTRGFTLLEMMVVVAIIGILVYVGLQAFQRDRPRSSLKSVATELESTLRFARQEALTRGVEVAVLVFPKEGPDEGEQGKVFVLQDEPVNLGLSFFDAGQDPNFSTFDPASPQPTPHGALLDTIVFPRDVVIGPDAGKPGDPLPFPYDAISTAEPCSFCGADGTRGAIVFDPRGRAELYQLNGTNIQRLTDSAGGSFTLRNLKLRVPPSDPTSTIVITRPQGMVRVIDQEDGND